VAEKPLDKGGSERASEGRGGAGRRRAGGGNPVAFRSREWREGEGKGESRRERERDLRAGGDDPVAEVAARLGRALGERDGLVELGLQVGPRRARGPQRRRVRVGPPGGHEALGGEEVAEAGDAEEVGVGGAGVGVGVDAEEEDAVGVGFGGELADGADDGLGGEAVGVAVEGGEEEADAVGGARGGDEEVTRRDPGRASEGGEDVRGEVCVLGCGVAEAAAAEEDEGVLVALAVEGVGRTRRKRTLRSGLSANWRAKMAAASWMKTTSASW
jgi:hypothetical protein